MIKTLALKEKINLVKVSMKLLTQRIIHKLGFFIGRPVKT